MINADVTIKNGSSAISSSNNPSGNLTVYGDITLHDGGSLKEAGGTSALTFDSSGNITKIGQDTPSTNQFLKWDGSKAVWDAASSSLNDLSNVSISSPSNGQVLKYNGSAWVNDTDATGGGGGSGSFTAVSYTHLTLPTMYSV